jgi:hypothetical protein
VCDHAHMPGRKDLPILTSGPDSRQIGDAVPKESRA